MKIYNILIIVTFVLSLYIWSYDNFFYEITYVRYLPNYQEEVSFPTYSPTDIHNGKTYNIHENVPFLCMMMYKVFPIALVFVYLMVIITFTLGLFLLFKKRKLLNFKWYLTQIILYSGIVFFILNTQIID